MHTYRQVGITNSPNEVESSARFRASRRTIIGQVVTLSEVLESAGINRHGEGDERADDIGERAVDHLTLVLTITGTESCH